MSESAAAVAVSPTAFVPAPHLLNADDDFDTATSVEMGSKLIDYNLVAQRYSRFRRSIGMGLVAKFVAERTRDMGIPLKRVHAASFCCGTGQNEEKLLKKLPANLGRLICLDASDGMLGAVESRLAGYDTGFQTRQIDVVRDDFEMDPVHFAMCVQATQHLDSHEEDYANVREFLRKVREKLIQGGLFSLVISTPDQIRKSHWFISVMSDLDGLDPEQDPAHHFAREHAPLSTIMQILEEVGFAIQQTHQLQGPHFRRKPYFGPASIAQDAEFRDSSSFFEIARSRDLLDGYDARLEDMIDSGSIDEHRRQAEDHRSRLGVSYLLNTVAV